jgi:AAA15 family ATPase/GTPase
VGKSNILEAIGLFGLNGGASIKDIVRLKEIPTIFFNGSIEEELMVLLNNGYGINGTYSQNAFELQFRQHDGTGQFQKINPVLNRETTKTYHYESFDKYAGIMGADISFDQFIVKKYEFKKDIDYHAGNYSSLEFPYGKNIFSILQTNSQIKKDAKELFDAYDLKLLYDSREQQFTIIKETNSGIFTVPYELVADTLQRLLFYKAGVYSNRNTVLLFEEPEAHMFPPYISKLTSDIWFHKGNQYFITSHSPFVVNDFLENARDELSIYIVEYKRDLGETIVIRLTEEQVHEAYQYGIDIFFNLESITR